MNQEPNLPLPTQSTSLKASNKEASEVCANCATDLNGQFCHVCGQSSKSMIKFFGEVIKELLDDALGYDSRLKHSLLPLLFRPGRLTLDYVKGKRFHYVLPFKLYLITSVLFILIIKNTANTNDIHFDNDNESQKITSQLSKEEKLNKAKEKIEGAFKGLPAVAGGVKKDLVDAVEAETIKPKDGGDKKKNTVYISSGDDHFALDWNSETEQFDGVDKVDNFIIKSFLEKINPKIKEWKKNPSPLIDSIFRALPYMMFVILPIFALFLKLFYFFSNRFYTEHLVFLLHNHSFIYILMMLQIGFEFGEEYLLTFENGFAQFAASSLDFLSMIFGFWMIIYVFLAMKRFYRQSWKMTISKTLALGFIYTILLSFGFIFTMAFGAYQA